MKELSEQFSGGSIRALARVLTRVENRAPGSWEFLRSIFPRTGRARIFGITGSPGSGKSTLVDHLASRYATPEGSRVGVVAVDPSSPYSHGAILGDRIRMQASDAIGKVFIRSMATRGHLGGLAVTTADVVTVIDAWGIDPIMIETVGVGQDEVEIARLAEVSVVVLVPGLGDDIQALKAGIMEIGDIFVINKCDQPGADRLEGAIRSVLELAPAAGWTPPIVRTVATTGEGVDQLREAMDRCRQVLAERSEGSRRKHLAARDRLLGMLSERLVRIAAMDQYGEKELDAAVDAIVERRRDPYSVVDEILSLIRPGEPS